jgi:hypothetical protein
MKKWITRGLTGLVGIVATVVVTKLLSGEPLTGIAKLKGLVPTIKNATVPAWAFAAALFVALFGLYETSTHVVKAWRRKGKVHFVPDTANFGWAGNDGRTDLRAGGTFTYDGVGSLIIASASLKGTKLKSNMMAQILTGDGLGSTVSVHTIELRAHTPVRALLNLWLTPVKAERGKPLRGQLVLRDTYNQNYKIDAVDWPWIGGQIPQKPAQDS